ncbi:MAG: hypothetical protein QGG19_07255 [Alphaproteobacteria bacterium]|nr:hypothetical protein [Alphaproteobacteria bacterium]MDP6255980.1 hypothetical protein [Alphaproteobacteria bacterium]MDP7054268.1 hypothetical protein [Alphaproteobacteria bacterium]MDP7229938.1 hypothetical protein [Alphaproteobacteria bacterium]MDP7460045.1 hypothetical protein [Alphaproteobacteria bacterium]
MIGFLHEKWREQVHAIARLAESQKLDEAGIIAHCREWIAN